FADAFGDRRVLGAIAYTCINRVGPAEIDHTAHGLVRIGAFANADPATAEAVAALMRDARIDAAAVNDLHHYRWQKLVWNIPFNGWGAVMDRHTQQLLDTPGGERLIRDTMEEVVRAAAAVGVALEAGIADDQIGRTRQMGAYHSSMQLDRQAGRAMEVDAVVAEPLRRAKAAGCGPLPNIESMLACLRTF
ncbi:MAG TPA: ketopantoate reductase C-terminal domain-containing protein, partial [Tepidisphaeraceae bacterium]